MQAAAGRAAAGAAVPAAAPAQALPGAVPSDLPVLCQFACHQGDQHSHGHSTQSGESINKGEQRDQEEGRGVGKDKCSESLQRQQKLRDQVSKAGDW